MAVEFRDRAFGCLLGLALGDAYGRPLELLTGERVRHEVVVIEPGIFRWTDDTHMSLYLAEAVVEHGACALDENRLGTAIAEAFERWIQDPLTPSTGPGETCQAGVRRWQRHRDWRTSGGPHSDGCGAVMRIAPLAIAYNGTELDRAAAISAVVTHGHPNATEAAVAACRLLRGALDQGRFDRSLVEEVIAAHSPATLVSQALRAALHEGDRPRKRWLDEAAIPAGDGGWQAPSALGLSVAAALCWGDDFATAIDRAARIDGDSDSVAALTGMFLGAAGGEAVLPATWVDALFRQDQLRGTVVDLLHR
jgi:ADP-ribosylglycohydrolase